MVHVHLHTTLLVTLLALNAYAAPSYNPNLHYKRQNKPFDGPQTVQTHDVIPANGGNVVRDCTIVFTPIVVQGENLVREERSCTDVFVPDGQPLPPPPPAISTTSTVPPESTNVPPPANTTTNDPPVVTTTDPPVDTTPAPPPPGTTSPPVVETTTTEAAPTTAESAPSPADTNVPPTEPDTEPDPAPDTPPAPGSPSDTAENPPTTPSVTGVPTGSRANNESEATQSSDKVELPGKKFEVVPIGLGVFAGISVIALIVVGLVTYERTKYRKAFRARRLAASGAEMGYGGMSERR